MLARAAIVRAMALEERWTGIFAALSLAALGEAAALRQAGTEPEALRSTIEQTKGYIGISGIYNLTPEDHNGLGTDSLVIVKVEKGKWVLVQ